MADLYTTVNPARDQDFAYHIGFTNFFDLVDNDRVRPTLCWLSLCRLSARLPCQG